MAQQSVLPSLPAPFNQLLKHIEKNSATNNLDLFKPYRDYDAKIRELYAQDPKSIRDGEGNIVSVFDGPGLRTRARKLDAETEKEKDCYIMSLSDDNRHASGSPAIVENLKEFKNNFSVFTEQSLSDLDWSNVVVAGSAALTPLLPVPEKYKESKRALRQYYHEELAPASDVDLFLYGLTEDQAKDKIKQIEARIRDSILSEVTCIRTKNAITIASEYPTRHVQIVLRIYKDVSEILTGFDVDCSCVAYDGQKVWAAPRALQAMMTQVNHIDLSRRSPSYENRLSKYARRGFEVHFSDLDRSRVDPTIFERSFMRTLGLARLLVLEKLPGSTDRDHYANLRRKERGRPEMNLWRRNMHKLKGNIKGDYEDEVSDWWIDQEDVSDYHTFTIPYGQRFNAKKIEKLLYTKDLLLNAEWNKPRDREVNLHRHPAFFGFAADVFEDCCGHCPKPVTDEEFETAEQEDKIYVKGGITFIQDDPGRQTIGSFNPITDTDWTEMAYVGNTARLCAAIVDGDLEAVKEWLARKDADPNQRDHTGRTPLQLAVTCSTLEIVRALINADARLVARMANGHTALHLAAERGNAAIIKAILERSERNEAEHEEKEIIKKEERRKAREADGAEGEDAAEGKKMDLEDDNESDEDDGEDDEDDEDEDDEDEDDEDWHSDADSTSMATESFVKVKDSPADKVEALPDDDTDEPDFYDVNVVSWDVSCSPLHLAILNGHIEAVKTLVDTFGADVLLPVKLLNDYDKSPRAAILTLVLALALPQEQAHAMAKTLLDLHASSSQADLKGTTAIQYFVNDGADSLDFMLEADKAAAVAALNHVSVSKNSWNPETNSCLLTAISNSDTLTCLKILEAGVAPDISFSAFIKQAKLSADSYAKERLANDPTHAQQMYHRAVEQPIVVAIANDLPDIAMALLERGADPNTLPRTSAELLSSNYGHRPGLTILDIVRIKIEKLKTCTGETDDDNEAPLPMKTDEEYLKGLEPGSYKHWVLSEKLSKAREKYNDDLKRFEEKKAKVPEGLEEKKEAIKAALEGFQILEKEMCKRGAKRFKHIHPTVGSQSEPSRDAPYRRYREIKNPFDPSFTFRVGELQDDLKEKYLQLFDAAWNGDLDTIKELTLKPRGDQPPLKAAVQDDCAASPFSIATIRGHLDVAQAILEIVLAQYSPKEKEKDAQYSIARRRVSFSSDDTYDSYDGESGDEVINDLTVIKRIVDDTFTIETIGEVSLKVDSHTTPLEVLEWSCPTVLSTSPGEKKTTSKVSGLFGLLGHAMQSDDEKLFYWLLDLGHKYSTMKTENGITPAGTFYNIAIYHLRAAIQLGRTKMIGELLKRSGAGIPFEDLVKKSGVKDTEKPKYYQGLSVYGKKRADWAAQGRRMQTPSSTGSQVSPLLEAARYGVLESLEYLLSDTPVRLYHEFAKANKDDKRVKRLSQADGGIEKAITDWYYANEESLINAVVIGSSSADSDRKLNYLIKAYPKHLDAKSAAGETPLQLAYGLGRQGAARILLDAGADPLSRDKAANNLIHRALSNFNVNFKNHTTERLSALIKLLDGKTRKALFAQRNTATAGGGTPIHNWIASSAQYNPYSYYSPNRELEDAPAKVPDVAKAMLSLSGGEELSLINGAGDTPLHSMVANRKPELVELLLEEDPDLLYRENATGRTPYELAHDLYTALKLKDPPAINAPQHSSYYFGYNNDSVRTINEYNPDTFLKKDKKAKLSDEEKIWMLCKEVAEKNPGKRRLVSLNEANEVARRVGDMVKMNEREAVRYRRIRRYGEDEIDEETGEKKSAIEIFLGDGTAWESLQENE